MNNPFSDPKLKIARPRIFLWGPPGAGKTRCALSLGNVALIDLEKGSQYYKDEFRFDLMEPKTFEDILVAVRWLATNKHSYNTLVIDPITIAWDMCQEEFLIRKRQRKNDPYAEITGGDWKTVKPRYKSLMDLLCKIDMNVVAIARSGKNYVADGGELLKVDKDDPEAAQAEKNTAYIMDTELQLKAVRSNGNVRFMATMRKDRSNRFPTTAFEFTKQNIQQYFGSIVDQESQPMSVDELNAIPCSDCGKPITDTKLGDKMYTASQLVDLTMDKAERALCPNCFRVWSASQPKPEPKTDDKAA